MPKQKFKSGKIYKLQSKFCFWPFFLGGFFGLGYSITKTIFLSKIVSKQATQINSNNLRENKIFQERNLSQARLHQKHNIAKEQEITKIIDIPAYANTYIRLKINYSDRQNTKEHEIFKNSFDFFQKETTESLIQSLNNTKKLNLIE